ncbi:MAG TPA: MBL fold metallo-hydrolase [Cytophagaceae bacterium]|nr:MBL fold metallo-hydrolase [Cytophagaceae bacterium]
MIVTFLGTGTSQGIPTFACECEVCTSVDYRDKRLRTSLHLTIEGKSFVFDSGPDFRQQILRERITKLDALIFTHEHKDHTAGLDDVRGFNYKEGGKSMRVFGRITVLDTLRKEFSYAFTEHKYPGVPLIDLIEIENAPFEIDGIKFTPIEVMHHKLPVFGYRIKDFTYITDANFISETELEKIKGTKVLVLNALRKEKHLSHFNLQEALEIIEKVQPEKAYLLHLSHQMGKHLQVEKSLPANVHIAYDGLKLNLQS